MVSDKLQLIVNKTIEKKIESFRWDYQEFINYFFDLMGNNINEQDIIAAVFKYIIDVVDEDPLIHYPMNELNKLFYPEVINNILTYCGWYDKYFNLNRYMPIITDGKVIKKNDFRDIKWINGEPYLVCNDWECFADLFDDSNTAGRILSSDHAEIYGWFDVDVEDDIKDNLDEKSLKHIKDYIIENGFIGKPIEYLDDEYGDILTEENLDDVDTLFHLISDEPMFSDLLSELENFYRWAYESAAEQELFAELRSQIEEYFMSEGKWDNEENGGDYNLYFNISKVFLSILREYIECDGAFPEDERWDFTSIVYDLFKCQGTSMDIRDMDYFYPNSTIVAEHFNENIISNL